MTSRQALLTVVGLTHASSVMAVVRCSDAESAMVTRALEPLKVKALSNLPVVHVAFEIVPVFPWPDRSVMVVPEPSLNAYAATRLALAACVVAVAVAEYGPRLPAASVART